MIGPAQRVRDSLLSRAQAQIRKPRARLVDDEKIFCAHMSATVQPNLDDAKPVMLDLRQDAKTLKPEPAQIAPHDSFSEYRFVPGSIVFEKEKLRSLFIGEAKRTCKRIEHCIAAALAVTALPLIVLTGSANYSHGMIATIISSAAIWVTLSAEEYKQKIKGHYSVDAVLDRRARRYAEERQNGAEFRHYVRSAAFETVGPILVARKAWRTLFPAPQPKG